ncbi:MAG: Asp-tRNA(Asn)/Glu-tRNA(Gln) amidotransferase subunit GatC [Alphaproteobacteria bacterium]
MTICKEDIERIERLARLSLDPDDLTEFSERLAKVFNWIDQLKEVDVSDTAPMISPVIDLIPNTPLREDKVNKPNTDLDVLSNAPHKEFNYFLVPKIVE